VSEKTADVLLVGPPVEQGEGVAVLRRRGDRLEVGELREMREGQPLSPGAEIVRLRGRSEHGRLFDVEVLAELPGGAARTGPAQVASEAYRRGWDAAFRPAIRSDDESN